MSLVANQGVGVREQGWGWGVRVERQWGRGSMRLRVHGVCGGKAH